MLENKRYPNSDPKLQHGPQKELGISTRTALKAMFAQPHWKVQQPDPKERGNERARHEAYGVNPTSSSNKDSDSKQQQSLEKTKTKTTKNKQKKAQNKQEQAHKQEPVC